MSSGSGRAWVSDGARVFFARAELLAGSPFSPVTELIQGIYRRHREQARKILRARIYTDHEPTPMCLAMVKVAAKRLTCDPALAPPVELPPIDVTAWPRYVPPTLEELRRLAESTHAALGNSSTGALAPDPSTDLSSLHSPYLTLARKLAATETDTATIDAEPIPRYARDRRVGAVLVSREGELLAGARNWGSVSRALHAEVNLVQSWYRATAKPLPVGARIYVSLKCCRMCAAMIWQAAEDIRSIGVYYGKDDPGPNARATALDRGTYDRERAVAGNPALANLEIQFGPFAD